jgi:succinate-semialdehyde dehydrogenase/glutarate-semialdehyde dehydrogenase
MTYPNTQLFINGQWQDAADGKSLAVFNPATGQEIGRVAHAGIADLDAALAAAQRGFETWRDLPAIERNKIMRRAAALMRERAGAIGALLTQEQGKPLVEAKGEAMAAADIIEWFADEGLRVYGRIVPSRFNLATRQMVLKDPVGPVAAFTPWNFPINQVVRKMAAALATGCSMIVKAAEETPASPAELIRAFADAGLPSGVLGLVYGNPADISNYLIPHPVIRKITFTGSTPVGKQLAALAGQHMKRVTMELGGHAPVIVAEDADVALAVKAAGGAKFRNAGQVCISPTRFPGAREHPERICRRAGEVHAGPEGGRRRRRGHDDGSAGEPAPPHRHGRIHAGRAEGGRDRRRRRRAHRRRRQLLAAHHPDRRAAVGQGVQRRALRPDGRDPPLQHAR